MKLSFEPLHLDQLHRAENHRNFHWQRDCCVAGWSRWYSWLCASSVCTDHRWSLHLPVTRRLPRQYWPRGCSQRSAECSFLAELVHSMAKHTSCLCTKSHCNEQKYHRVSLNWQSQSSCPGSTRRRTSSTGSFHCASTGNRCWRLNLQSSISSYGPWAETQDDECTVSLHWDSLETCQSDYSQSEEVRIWLKRLPATTSRMITTFRGPEAENYH